MAINSQFGSVGFGLRRFEKRPQDFNPWSGKYSGGWKLNQCRQRFQRSTQRLDGVAEHKVTCVSPYLADHSERANGAELLENIRVAQQCTLKRSGLAGRQMGADGLNRGRDFLCRETKLFEELRYFPGGVDDVVPLRQRGNVFGPVTDKHAEVMQPRGGVEHIIVVRLIVGNARGQVVEARLMTKLVPRFGLRADVVGDGLPVSRLIHDCKNNKAAQDSLVFHY